MFIIARHPCDNLNMCNGVMRVEREGGLAMKRDTKKGSARRTLP